jgi:hypothetical protein
MVARGDDAGDAVAWGARSRTREQQKEQDPAGRYDLYCERRSCSGDRRWLWRRCQGRVRRRMFENYRATPKLLFQRFKSSGALSTFLTIV